jgi:hypothetical protein
MPVDLRMHIGQSCNLFTDFALDHCCSCRTIHRDWFFVTRLNLSKRILPQTAEMIHGRVASSSGQIILEHQPWTVCIAKLC